VRVEPRNDRSRSERDGRGDGVLGHLYETLVSRDRFEDMCFRSGPG
jgi:hypothetical protein